MAVPKKRKRPAASCPQGRTAELFIKAKRELSSCFKFQSIHNCFFIISSIKFCPSVHFARRGKFYCIWRIVALSPLVQGNPRRPYVTLSNVEMARNRAKCPQKTGCGIFLSYIIYICYSFTFNKNNILYKMHKFQIIY